MNCPETASLVPLYLSGELDAARAATLVAHLQTCTSCAREVEQQRDLDTRLRDALLNEDTGSAALIPVIHRRIAVARAKRRVLTIGAIAAAVVLASGLLLRQFAVSGAVPAIFADAAKDHHREVIEKRVKKWRSEADEIAALAHRQGIPASAISALAAAGYRLDRARMCRLDGGMFMHLVYTDGTREMSVFLRPRKGDAIPLRAEDVGVEHVVAVQSGSLAVVCVSEESRAAMNLARSAAAAL
jgi:anti-sigma factor RsiW